ncbi:MAG: ferric reductase-like transmembrane domain-containing protein, partial [Thiothrix sp.]|nr:ferric reductase-like transmembrane domain-containing protein [Thiothrix sp.]
MKNIKLALWAILLGLTGLWLLAVAWPESVTFFSIRGVMVQYSGVMGMGVMSIAMFLALRPRWLEPVLGGLDKSYRLHKWLGIAGLIISVMHWLWAKGPKWMVGWGLLERPQRGPRPEVDSEAVLSWSETIQQLFREQRGFAESVGEWAFYAAAILMILALIKAFPYHWFAKTHQWIAVAYLVLVFHATILVEFSYWSQPVGWVTALLMIAGTVSAVLVLLGRVGASHRVKGSIEALEYHKELRVLETTIKLDNGWPGHQAGQFAFVNFDDKEGRHPFTIASDWNPETRSILFISKALGDYTELLPDHLHVKSAVSVEGPYG